MSGIPLRRRLLVLTAAAILPVVLMAAVGLFVLEEQQYEQVERVGLELANSVAVAIDTELDGSVSVLEALATALALDKPDPTAFREHARRVLVLRPEWAAVRLADLTGKTLMDTRFGDGEPVPEIVERASFEQVLDTGLPAFGGLARYSPEGWLFAVRVAVVRGGESKYVLSALVKPEAIRDVLTRQRVPADWLISIVDGNRSRVARSREHAEHVGGRLSPTVGEVVEKGGADGFGVAYSLEGKRIFTPYSRLRSSGWTAVLGIPTDLVDAAVTRSLAVLGGGVLLSILLGTLGALWVARRINRPMTELRAAAESLGRREPPQTPDTTIQEIHDVATALRTASELLARGEVERDELLQKERAAREAAEAADRAKEEFMAVLSHELRTPLNAVYGWARMLQSGQVRGEALMARAMDAIVRNADAQVQMIDDLLDLSRITRGKMRLDVQSVDLAELLRGALDAVRPAAEAKGIRLAPALDADTGPVLGDASRLQQIVSNLLTNAVKFTPQGGRIELLLRRAGAHVEIVVRDTGQGIRAEALPHIFERFRQADSSSTRAHSGLGLGLALVKHLAELHGGSVVAHSDGERQGATFVVTLPIAGAARAAAAAAPEPAAAALDSAAAFVRLDGLRVLVTDDDGESIALAEAIIARAGAEVRTCRTAAETLDQLAEWRPDVLVSDIEMPGEDGYSLIARIRALRPEDGGDTPAIALSAYGRDRDRRRSLAAGFSMHVPKPVDPGELTAIIASVSVRGRAPS